MLQAHFTNATKRQPATLSICVMQNGDRQWIKTIEVANKREARKVAKELGATPWNF